MLTALDWFSIYDWCTKDTSVKRNSERAYTWAKLDNYAEPGSKLKQQNEVTLCLIL